MKNKYLKSMLILFISAAALAAQTIKWEQQFATTTIPNAWQVIDADGNGSGLELVTTKSTPEEIEILPQIGVAFWTSNVQNSNLAGVIDEWLISPRISVIYAGDSLHFYAGANDQGFDDSIRVKISTTNANLESFVHQLANIKVDGPPGEWNLYSFDLSAFDSSDIHFAINYYINDGGTGGQNSDFVWMDHPFITGDIPVSIENDIKAVPKGLVLNQNYPNPFNPRTTIDFELAESEYVQLNIFNISGQLINQLVNQNMQAGFHKVVWSGQDTQGSQVASGVYIYQIRSGSYIVNKKMILMK